MLIAIQYHQSGCIPWQPTGTELRSHLENLNQYNSSYNCVHISLLLPLSHQKKKGQIIFGNFEIPVGVENKAEVLSVKLKHWS